MNYVGLAQQGFYQPYELLQQGLSAGANRRMQQEQFNKQLALKNAQFEQDKVMDEARRQAIQQDLAGQQFQLGEAKKQAGQKDFLATLDFNKYKTPDRPFPLIDAGPAQAFDPNQQWAAQPDVVRQQVLAEAAKRFVSPEQVAGAYNARVGVNTGQPVRPSVPGMRVGELDFPGGKMIPDYSQSFGGAGTGGTGIKTMTDEAGNSYRFTINPITGAPMFLHPDLASQRIGRLSSEENEKLSAFKGLQGDIAELEKSVNGIKNFRGPVLGNLVYNRSMLNPGSWFGAATGGNVHTGAYSPEAADVDTKWQMMWLNLARALGEKGNLSDTDRRSWQAVKPSLSDTPEVAAKKFADMKQMAERRFGTYMDTLKGSGRTVNDNPNGTFSPLSATGSKAPAASAESVVADYKAGKISYDEAAKQLQSLGVQP